MTENESVTVNRFEATVDQATRALYADTLSPERIGQVHPMPYLHHSNESCGIHLHTEADMPCSCGLTVEDICPGCGTYECLDLWQCSYDPEEDE